MQRSPALNGKNASRGHVPRNRDRLKASGPPSTWLVFPHAKISQRVEVDEKLRTVVVKARGVDSNISSLRDWNYDLLSSVVVGGGKRGVLSRFFRNDVHLSKE